MLIYANLKLWEVSPGLACLYVGLSINLKRVSLQWA